MNNFQLRYSLSKLLSRFRFELDCFPMADKDNRQGPFAKVLQKHAGRAKERILQNLGKADRTTDVDFDVCVKNINKLQAAVTRLQKEFKNYYMCLKAMQASRKSLMDTVNELYEPCWGDLDNFNSKSEVLNKNFEDFCEKVNDQLLTPVASYISQFPELNTKIAKRNRKLLDYDNCRHNLQNIETVKKREEAKITKAKEQLEEARNLFEVINSELHDEIPALYDSRVSFFVSNLQCLFLAEAHFHSEDSSIFLELNSILEAVAAEASKSGIEKFKMPCIESQASKPAKKESKSSTTVEEKEDGSGSSSGSGSGSGIFCTPPTSAERNYQDSSPESNTTEVFKEESGTAKEISAGDNPVSEPYRYLYQVKGTYKYTAEDADELSFNVGDIIDVIAYDDPEEQEEGWLMGVFNGKKGLFPANFTSRI